ncbi:hypothetical protein NP493_1705g00000 [Ridgeia piscesae]|uniref:Uncharacterized protein n=1 Tax=Ridgeia piscesae TaxID=27915 RepID=A0AAD9JUS6_RIDPI|nr:hypothetical protein NP493_1705g00000 [Ridgeia piscesae]
MSTWDRYQEKTKPGIFNEKSRPDGQQHDAKHRDVFKGNIGTCLKRHVYNSCVLQAMIYGAETWPSKEQASSHTYSDKKEYVKHHISWLMI